LPKERRVVLKKFCKAHIPSKFPIYFPPGVEVAQSKTTGILIAFNKEKPRLKSTRFFGTDCNSFFGFLFFQFPQPLLNGAEDVPQ
jgi:hypothetical protein